MQYTEVNSNDILKTIPEHFPKTFPIDTESNPNIKVPEPGPPQNVSFSSSYTASRFGNIGSQHNTNNSFDTFETKPILSFAVLNTDDLTTPHSAKPNAIVRPFRRPEQHLPGPLLINGSDSSGLHVPQEPQLQESTEGRGERSFADELNRKLLSMHTRESYEPWLKLRKTSKKDIRLDSVQKRPLFITTVPTGIFLPPAKDPLNPPSYRRRIYAYSSYPVVLNNSYNHSTLSYNYNNTNTQFSKDKIRGNTAPINAAYKAYNTQMTSSLHRKEMRDGEEADHCEAVRYKHSIFNGVKITNEQFHKQIPHYRAKRETPAEPYKNVMHERRVVRGSNFGSTNLLADNDPFDKAAEIRRRQAIRKRTQARNQRNILGTPPPVKGRCHEVVQTEKYLEELIERPLGFSVDTQTDLLLERPPTPPYVPTKVSVDVSTEIIEGELFHFDVEVQPIIELYVDACIEQSMFEVTYEQEIQALHKKQEEFLAQRKVEYAEFPRLYIQGTHLKHENERRLYQDSIPRDENREVDKGVTAAKLLQGHIARLLPEVLENLEPGTDAARKEKLMTTICPWLTVEVAEEVGQIVDSREILTVIIQEIIKQRATVYSGYKEEKQPETESPALICDGNEHQVDLEISTCESKDSKVCPVPKIEDKL